MTPFDRWRHEAIGRVRDEASARRLEPGMASAVENGSADNALTLPDTAKDA